MGEVVAVTGVTVQVQIHAEQPALALVAGEAHRVGQVGGFLRIPVGYSNLYGVCTQVGSAAAPSVKPKMAAPDSPLSLADNDGTIDGRWLTMSLFGEAVGGEFERGLTVYPTVGDEVHLVQAREVAQIFQTGSETASIEIGTIAATNSLPAMLDLPRLVSRHSAVLGSTGAGKSNFVAALMEAIATSGFPSARVLVIDAHGEYASALSSVADVFSVNPRAEAKPLYVPFWALPFDELLEITTGPMSENNAAELRTEIERRKRKVAESASLVSPELVSADSPIPFSINDLWYDLYCRETQTYEDNQAATPTSPVSVGDPGKLVPPKYPPHMPSGSKPYAPRPKGIGRQLNLMRNRLKDARFDFLFSPGDKLSPNLGDGSTSGDLDSLLASWIGHDKPVTVLDMSGAPSEVLPLVTGAVLQIVYDALFWAGDLPVSGRIQPLLVVLEEAHLFVKSDGTSIANRTVARIAKEGRKYGVGLMMVSQRPSELDHSALSQCGTVVALRTTNAADRSYISSMLPDEMALLADQLPGLRTGEAIISGEATVVPARVRIRKASGHLAGADANVRGGWALPRPDGQNYAEAVARWRSTSSLPDEPNPSNEESGAQDA